MLRKKIKAFPNYNRFIKNLIYFKQNKYHKKKLRKWLLISIFYQKDKVFFLKKFILNLYFKISFFNTMKKKFFHTKRFLKYFVKRDWWSYLFLQNTLKKYNKLKRRTYIDILKKKKFKESKLWYVHINFTKSNIFATITDFNGNVFIKKSSGLLDKVSGSSKRYFVVYKRLVRVILLSLQTLIKQTKQKKKWIVLKINNLILRRKAYQLRKFLKFKKWKMKFVSIEYIHKRSHNGIRLKKARRI